MAKPTNARSNVPSPAPAAAPVAQAQAGVDNAKIEGGGAPASVKDSSSEAASLAPPDSGGDADVAPAGSNPSTDAVVSCLVLSNLHHNGEHYEPGSTVDLTPDQAAQLPGVVKAVADLDVNQAAIMAAAVKVVADSEGA